MADLFYFDTSIWLDHYENRGEHGTAALQLILKIITEDKMLIASEFVVKELKQLGYGDNEISALFRMVKPDHFHFVYTTKEQIAEAKRIVRQREIPFGDVIHAIVARDHGAQLVSRDSDFSRLKDITIAKPPEALFDS